MTEKIRQTIIRQKLFESGDDAVVIGLSGGPDSLCLLSCMIELREELGLKQIAAVHVNHMYRGDEAYADEEFCRAFCEKQGVKFRAWRFDVEKIASETSESSEEVGRRLRYQVFRETAAELGRAKIAVAHNKEDNAETILMRLARGTGTEGLCGIEYKRDEIIRPLLDVSRKEIEQYCADRGLEPRIDRTNLQPVYTRNKVRLEIIPYINRVMDCDIVETLTKLSHIAREDSRFFERAVEEAAGLASEAGKSPRSLKLSVLKSLDPAVRKRLLVKVFAEEGLPQDIGAAHLEAAEKLIFSEKTTGDVSFPRDYLLKKRYEVIIIQKPGAEEKQKLMLETRAITDEKEVKEILAALPDRRSKELQYFDREKLRRAGEPVLRFRRPGDTISPKGFRGTKKLQDYFIDRKIDRDLRDSLPLVAAGSRIVWIPGRELSEGFIPDAETAELIQMKLTAEAE